ncbi:MAG: TraB/GumN family protein, partial [Steroidobacteraceae bacterium]|nr:TraB/GumN family protein [Steroidobacteraceae bacterium]
MIRQLAVLVASATIATAAMAAPAVGQSVLWSVRGEHNTVYLFGSIHVLRPGDVGLPSAAEAAYDDAEQLVMEIDMDDPAVADPGPLAVQMQSFAQLPAGQSLETVLGSDYPAVAAQIAATGLDPAVLDGFAPWFVGLMVLQLEMTKRGFDSAHGIEQQVAERALEDGKPILGLETPADQFAVLAGLTLPQQKRFLLMTLEEPELVDARLDQLLTAWRTGDTVT